jgi:pyruvate ferredoxin oxidoreductase alpha subunit
MPDAYFEFRRAQAAAIDGSLDVFEAIAEGLEGITGRALGALDQYRLHDADIAIVALGASAGTVKDVVDELRADGKKAGALRICSFRRFPAREVREALRRCRGVAVLDRADAPGGTPPLFADVAAALYGSRVHLRSVVCALGGRDLTPAHVHGVFHDLDLERLPLKSYVGLKETECLV